ncbi:MAG: serine protease [Myxococcaceae bacterium]
MHRVWAGILPACALWLAAVGCAPVREVSAAEPSDVIRRATISLPGRCAGVVAQGGEFAVTAAHCISPEEDFVAVEFFDGSSDVADVALLDRGQDIAILDLTKQAPAEGLPFATALPEPGSNVYFGGRLEAMHPVQFVRVVRLGRCPSLPEVPQALFTSLRGEKGDSGAPVVDTQLQVVGLVHGGAACSIAAPTKGVTQLIASVEQKSEGTAIGGAGSAGGGEAGVPR